MRRTNTECFLCVLDGFPRRGEVEEHYVSDGLSVHAESTVRGCIPASAASSTVKPSLQTFR
jgi:hypothetical protein